MKHLFNELPQEQRVQALKDNCTKIEERYTVQRFFDKDELDSLREEVSNVSIDISELEDELKEISTPIKNQVKEKKLTLRSKLKLVKQKFDESEEEVYLFADHTEGVMLYYDFSGELISSRRLLPHERQTSIHQINKIENQSKAS